MMPWIERVGLWLVGVRWRFKARRFEHAGATEEWSPRATVAEQVEPAQLAAQRLDDEAQQILDRFDLLVADWYTDPDYMTQWRATVDASMAAAGASAREHHRWRESCLDIRTGAWPTVEAAA